MTSSTPAIISFVGKKNSGKTTVLVNVLRELKSRGFNVGTIKHAHSHDFLMDRPGKDSHRFYDAGADAVVVSSTVKLALLKRTAHEPTARELAKTFMGNMDIVLVEGYKTQNLPKIEIFRRSAHDSPLPPDPLLLALVTDDSLETNSLVFATSELSELVDFIVDNCITSGLSSTGVISCRSDSS